MESTNTRQQKIAKQITAILFSKQKAISFFVAANSCLTTSSRTGLLINKR